MAAVCSRMDPARGATAAASMNTENTFWLLAGLWSSTGVLAADGMAAMAPSTEQNTTSAKAHSVQECIVTSKSCNAVHKDSVCTLGSARTLLVTNTIDTSDLMGTRAQQHSAPHALAVRWRPRCRWLLAVLRIWQKTGRPSQLALRISEPR